MRLLIAPVLALLLLPLGAEAITFADGQVHVIDAANSFPFESVLVLDGPSGPTTVNLVPGGEVGTGLSISSGEIRAEGGSILNISGGEVNGGVVVRHSSALSMSGGRLEGQLVSTDAATVLFSGGEASIFGLHGSSAVVTGGLVRSNLNAHRSVDLDIFDVTAAVLGGIDNAVVEVFGGSFQDVVGHNSSQISLFGGNYSREFVALDSSMLFVHGFNFNFPFGDIPLTQGNLTGNLADGTPLSVVFGHASAASITLVDAPESSILALAALGLLLLAVRRARMKLVLLVAVALLLPAASFAQINVPHVFLGFTSSATFDGGQGIFTYHTACAAEFPNSRMCTSVEILQSPTTPAGLVGDAWVMPTFVPTGTGLAVDASGVEDFAHKLTCSSWTANGPSSQWGIKVDAKGTFSPSRCSVTRSISCCGPPVVVSQGDLNADGIVNLVDEAIFRRMLAGLTVYLP